MLGGLAQPEDGGGDVTLNAFTIEIHLTKSVLGGGKFALGGLVKPVGGFLLVSRNAIAVIVEGSQEILGGWDASMGAGIVAAELAGVEVGKLSTPVPGRGGLGAGAQQGEE